MRWLISVTALILAAPIVAGEQDKAKASAALALAKAKREREQTQLVVKKLPATACHTDYATAVKEAEKTGKPLVLWVGMNCESEPDLRKALDKAVHCHVEVANKSAKPRVLITGGDGIMRGYAKEKIDEDTAAKIMSAWNLPAQPPPARAGIGIEETRLVPVREPLLPGRRAAFYAGVQCAGGT